MSPKWQQTLLAPVSAIILASCATVAANPAAEEAAVRARSAEWNRAATARNLDAVMAIHSHSAVVMMPNSPTMSGTAAIRQGWQGMLGMPNLALNWQPTKITVARSGELATEVGTYTMRFDTPQGRVNDAGGYVTVWQKMDGNWVVATDIITSSQPVPQR